MQQKKPNEKPGKTKKTIDQDSQQTKKKDQE